MREAKRINGESTLRPTSNFRLPVLDPLIVAHDPRRQKGDVENSVEVGHLDVIVLDVGVLILSHHIDHIAREDAAIRMASLVARNHVLIFRRENAHVVLVANMNMRVLVVIENAHTYQKKIHFTWGCWTT